jgi:hypothetical protein
MKGPTLFSNYRLTRKFVYFNKMQCVFLINFLKHRPRLDSRHGIVHAANILTWPYFNLVDKDCSLIITVRKLIVSVGTTANARSLSCCNNKMSKIFYYPVRNPS